MNVAFLAGNTLLSPAVSDSILDGVTRNTVLQVARDWGFNVEERKVRIDEIVTLLRAGQLDGAFGVGTAATIAPIRLIHHEGVDYELKPQQETDFAPRVSAYLDRLKRGQETDTHGWNYKI